MFRRLVSRAVVVMLAWILSLALFVTALSGWLIALCLGYGDPVGLRLLGCRWWLLWRVVVVFIIDYWCMSVFVVLI